MKSIVLIIAGLLLLAISLSGCTEMLDSGRETLNTIKNTTSDVKDIVNDTGNIAEDVKDTINDTLDKIGEMVDDITDTISNLTNDTDNQQSGGGSPPAPGGGSGTGDDTPPEDNPPCEDYNLIIETDSDSYNRTGMVTVSGNLSSLSDCETKYRDIALQIKDPADNQVAAQMKTDSDGLFNFSYTLDAESPVGNYTVYAAFGSLVYSTTVFGVV